MTDLKQSDVQTIVNALRAAADKFREDAATNYLAKNLSVGNKFVRKAAACLELADRLEAAE